MEEFIFGTLATEEMKLLYHRIKRRGIQHANRINPRDPKPGEVVKLTVKTGPHLPADHVVCYYTTDGTKPVGAYGKASNGTATPLRLQRAGWSTLIWGYMHYWKGEIPAMDEGTIIRYQIGAWGEETEEVFADWPDVKATSEYAAGEFFRGESISTEKLHPAIPDGGNIFTYHVDTLTPPDWVSNTVMYQVFVDRFNPGVGKDWIQTDNLHDFMGGTIRGVTEKLDYIADLGADSVWLSPIFPSPTYHGYDATDYYNVEPRVGGNEALKELVEAAHAKGMRVILDMVCNHISSEHPIFLDALNNPDSEYRDWFTFNDSGLGYHAFFGVKTMPQVNLQNPAARDWMLDIARYWLREYDIDGYRLDHANGPGPDFWPLFRAACKEVKPDCFIFSEIMEPPDILQQYIGRLDGSLDFYLADIFRKVFAHEAWTEEQFWRFLKSHQSYFPESFIVPSFLDNHDMNRFLYIAGDDKEKLKKAVGILMELPNPPVIYYGTEIGLSQNSGTAQDGLEVCRLPMIWGDEQDTDLLGFFKDVIAKRKEGMKV